MITLEKEANTLSKCKKKKKRFRQCLFELKVYPTIDGWIAWRLCMFATGADLYMSAQIHFLCVSRYIDVCPPTIWICVKNKIEFISSS